MQCPSCGRENPEHPRPCTLCGYDPTVPYEPITPKTSKAAVVSLVLALLSFLTFLITAIPAIVFACVVLTKISRSHGRLKGKPLAIVAIAVSILAIPVFLATFYSLWRLDAPPIPNDYTIADLRSAPADCAESYELLLRLSDEYGYDATAIGLSPEDLSTISEVSRTTNKADHSCITEVVQANANSITRAWENGKKGRDILQELSKFVEIADLTEPNMAGEIKFLVNMRLLARLYGSYVCLQAEQGNADLAAKELTTLYSVFRKLSRNARSMSTRLVCISGLAYGIIAANFVANNPHASQKVLEQLGQHFEPLTSQETSLRNSMINDYLAFLKEMNKWLRERNIRKSIILKFNSTSRLYRNLCDDWIKQDSGAEEPDKSRLSVWPSIFPDLPVFLNRDGRVPRYYFVYNPVGSLLLAILQPTFEKMLEINTRLRIHDDLLQIVLNKRLGKEVSLKARAYGDEYIVDVQGKKIFSPGPDGKIDTKDDIELPINPEVLGWDN
ncbi:MAG: DUF4190 domain-containing protein [Planctomycetes bacterium]|nr:DUF4190 domain-containing protein [Planctomycetota bacterium]